MNDIAPWKRFETVTALESEADALPHVGAAALAPGLLAPVSASVDGSSGAALDPVRPASVPGPLGGTISLETLPPPDTRRWVVRRKA